MMFGWFDKSEKIAEKAADGIYNGIDKIYFSNEEKSDATEVGFKLWIEFQKATLPQNKARREIALAIVSLFCSLIVIQSIGIVFGFDFVKNMAELINTVSIPFGMIITFYFLKRFKNKFIGNTDND